MYYVYQLCIFFYFYFILLYFTLHDFIFIFLYLILFLFSFFISILFFIFILFSSVFPLFGKRNITNILASVSNLSQVLQRLSQAQPTARNRPSP